MFTEVVVSLLTAGGAVVLLIFRCFCNQEEDYCLLLLEVAGGPKSFKSAFAIAIKCLRFEPRYKQRVYFG